MSSVGVAGLAFLDMCGLVRRALQPYQESKAYGSSRELVYPNRLVNECEEVINSFISSSPLSTQSIYKGLYSSLFADDYIFPNKHALSTVNKILGESEVKIPIMSSLITLEGEGPEVGKPTLLIRISGCAVRCKGCDTPESWNALPEVEIDEGGTEVYNHGLMNVSEIADLIHSQCQHLGINRVSITGGEPLHYVKALRLLVADLWLSGYYINLETSGILFDPIIMSMVHLSIDIKTPSSKVDLSSSQLQCLNAILSYRYTTLAHIKAIVGNTKDMEFLLDNFSECLNASAPNTHRPLCITPFAPKGFGLDDVAPISKLVNSILPWMLSRGCKTSQFRIIVQQHKLLGYA